MFRRLLDTIAQIVKKLGSNSEIRHPEKTDSEIKLTSNRVNLANIYLFKVSNRNNRKRCETCS